MGRSGRRKQQQQQQQCGASRKTHCISTTLDVCLTCLKGEEWCFAIGEDGHIAPDQPPPWQEKEEPERPARVREDLHPKKRTSALSSEGVWDSLVEPGRDYEEGLLLPCLALPKDACLTPHKDACLAPPKDACLALHGLPSRVRPPEGPLLLLPLPAEGPLLLLPSPPEGPLLAVPAQEKGQQRTKGGGHGGMCSSHPNSCSVPMARAQAGSSGQNIFGGGLQTCPPFLMAGSSPPWGSSHPFSCS
ncbi:UNVERIFIED_CONTAM: hypothetical protein FKN15_048896 [Acipenser sinensis]